FPAAGEVGVAKKHRLTFSIPGRPLSAAGEVGVAIRHLRAVDPRRRLPLLPPDRTPAPSPPAAGAARVLSPSAPAPPDPPRLASSPSPSAGVQPPLLPCRPPQPP
uniref:Uncharacterized protein n=1 Tax=Zea mays TaxID=4577 RepID=A0A804MI33_MAIZE